MAGKALPDDVKENIVADFLTGQYSQRDLANEYGVSVGVVNKLTKGKEKTNAAIVNSLIQAEQALEGQDERHVNAVRDVVKSKISALRYLHAASLKNVRAAMQAECIAQVDFKHRGQTIQFAEAVINPKNPNLNMQLNAPQFNEVTIDEYLEARQDALNNYLSEDAQ